MATQQDVMIAFFGAFAGFSAFGTVIATFLVSSNALPRLGARWGAHGVKHAQANLHDAARKLTIRWAQRRRSVLLWSAGGLVALAALVSALGLVASFLWLHAHASGGAVGWGWAYKWTGYLLVAEVTLITLITVLAMGTAVWFAIKTGPTTEDLLRGPGPKPQTGDGSLKPRQDLVHGLEELLGNTEPMPQAEDGSSDQPEP